MHAQNPEHFQIPPNVIKRYVMPGQYVELRIDSSRFSMHQDDAASCSCPSCNGEMSNPILRHESPESLNTRGEVDIPSRGWGEDFWVRISKRSNDCLTGIVDNRLAESRLHQMHLGDEILFQSRHILAVHGQHRLELVSQMDASDLKELAAWIASQQTGP